MERLKSLNFQLVLDIDYDFSRLKLLKGEEQIDLPKGQYVHDFTISSVSHKEFLNFEGFDPKDKKQKIKLSLTHKDVKFDIHGISEFEIRNNNYVSDKKIRNVNDIYLNGRLTLAFFETWFCCNLLQGGVLQDKTQNKTWKFMEDYVNPKDACLNHNECLDKNKRYDIVFSGTCFTGTEHADYVEKIPYTLQKLVDGEITNISFNGISGYATLHNAHYLVDNFKMKTLIFCPSNSITVPVRRQFLDKFYIFPFLQSKVGFDENKFHSMKDVKDIRKHSVSMNHRQKHLVKNIMAKKYQALVEKCKQKNISLVLLVFAKSKINFWKQYEHVSVNMTQNPAFLLDILDRQKSKSVL